MKRTEALNYYLSRYVNGEGYVAAREIVVLTKWFFEDYGSQFPFEEKDKVEIIKGDLAGTIGQIVHIYEQPGQRFAEVQYFDKDGDKSRITVYVKNLKLLT